MLPRVPALLLSALLLAPAAQSSDLIEKLDGRTVQSILGDLDLDGGVHRRRVEDFFRTFDGALRLFLRHIE